MSFKNLFLILLLVPSFCNAGTQSSSTDLLKELDRIVESRKTYEHEKRNRILQARRDYLSSHTDTDKYNTLRTLYKEYRTFRIDSAVIIANERLEIARSTGNLSKIASATLNLAESYVKSGLPEKAIHMLDTLSKNTLEEYHRKYITSVYKNAYLLLSKTEVLPEEKMKAKEKVKEYREKALKEAAEGSRGKFTIRAEKFIDAGMYDEAVSQIEQADKIFDLSEDAAMQYTMGEIYLAAGMRDKAIECLARAAAIDLSSGTKEYQALILLASLLLEEGDVERAFVYINCALDDVNFSNANFRNPEIMENMPVIDQAFHAYEKRNKELTKTFLWIASVLVGLLIIFLILLLKTLKSNRRMLAANEDINKRLSERNSALEEAGKLQLKSINALIMSNARYISRLKDYRKTVYRFMKSGQYEKALEALKSDRTHSKDIDGFHEMFDELFLSIFPGFIEGVNRLIKQPVELKEPNRLTPELRVIALMRLGLSSTEEIAGILHYTSQTVYNLRSTVRSMAAVSREEFEKAIREL